MPFPPTRLHTDPKATVFCLSTHASSLMQRQTLCSFHVAAPHPEVNGYKFGDRAWASGAKLEDWHPLKLVFSLVFISLPTFNQPVQIMNLRKKTVAAFVGALLALGSAQTQAQVQLNTNAIRKQDIASDYALFYSKPNLYRLGLSMGLGAVVAHTIDENVSTHYQKNQRSPTTDDWSKTAKLFGEWTYLLPLSAAATYLDTSGDLGLGEWGNRTFRALVVGAPALWTAQVLTGGSRPSENRAHGADWRPFKDNNGVSGHAFVGAIPFLTLADMHQDQSWIYYTAMAASLATPLSRLNDNQHYLSQIVMGWYFAKQATSTVSGSRGPASQSFFSPLIDRDLVGVMYTHTLR